MGSALWASMDAYLQVLAEWLRLLSTASWCLAACLYIVRDLIDHMFMSGFR